MRACARRRPLDFPRVFWHPILLPSDAVEDDLVSPRRPASAAYQVIATAMPYQPRRRRAPLLREALVRSASQQPQSADTSQRMTWGEYREKIAEITQAGLSRLAGLDNDPATGLATASSAQRSEQAEYIRNWGEDMRSERWQDSVAESNALRSNLDSLLRRVQTETALTKRRWVSKQMRPASPCLYVDSAQPTAS